MSTASRAASEILPGQFRSQLALISLALLPFVTLSTGVDRYIGWAIGASILTGSWSELRGRNVWIVVAVGGLAAAAVGPPWFRGSSYHFGMIALSLAGLGIVLGWDRLTPRRALLLGTLASLGGLAWSLTHDPGRVLDVALMHHAGAEALRSGVSPWTGLHVPSGAPGTGGTFISGDPYPPITLLWYSIWDWIRAEPRLGGAAAWLILIGSGWLGRFRHELPMVVLLTSGALPLLLWTGWTEILTVALLAMALACWQRPSLSSTVLGSALASKQYMIVLAPLVMTAHWMNRRTRTTVTLVVAASLGAAGFLLGSGYLNAIVGVYGKFEARIDSSSIYGFISLFETSLAWPAWLAPVAAVIAATWLGVKRGIHNPPSFLLTGALSLTVFFLLGTQAFSNYWFLVWAILLMALARPFPAFPSRSPEPSP